MKYVPNINISLQNIGWYHFVSIYLLYISTWNGPHRDSPTCDALLASTHTRGTVCDELASIFHLPVNMHIRKKHVDPTVDLEAPLTVIYFIID